MNRRITTRAAVFGFVAAVAFGASASLAQTGSELLIKPWAKGQLVEARADAVFLNNGHITEDGSEFQMGFYETSGRARLMPDQRADPRFGYDVTYIDINCSDGRLPSSLTDTSVAFGVGIADWNGWLAGITLGVGYAAAGAYDDGNAYYGKADFIIGRDLDETSSIGFVIDYDGNRTAFPDVPLPGFAYTKKIDKTLAYSVGFPYNSVTWTPDKSTTFDRQLTVMGRFEIPDSFDARIDYALIEHFSVFASAAVRQEAFHWDQIPNSVDRLLFQQRRVEGGVIWAPCKEASLILAGGYAFDQEFNVGWDTQDMDRIAKPSDEMYLHVGLEVHF